MRTTFLNSLALLACLSTSTSAAPLSFETLKNTASSIARQNLFNLIPGNLQLPFGSASGLNSIQNETKHEVESQAATCFPSLGYKKPDQFPTSLENWWCPVGRSYGFLGFSYEVSACQSRNQLIREFKDARQNFNARFVRMYGVCDRPGFMDDVIEAAWEADLGVHALVWFGFDGDKQWIGRKDSLISTLTTNPKAPYVVRAVQFGSEPLYDGAVAITSLNNQIKSMQRKLSAQQIPVTISELAYGYQSTQSQGSFEILKTVDFHDIHMLPAFSSHARTGADAWNDVLYDLNFYRNNGRGKPIILSENGWPHKFNCPGVCPNSPNAVGSDASSKSYYDLLDSKCSFFKNNQVGGPIGWFAHIYNDNQEGEYGIHDRNGKLRFPFKPRTEC